MPRVKPFKYTYEKEIVMYAYFKKLDYFSTECMYAPFAARGFAREFVKDLEATRPSAIVDLITSAEQFRISQGAFLAMCSWLCFKWLSKWHADCGCRAGLGGCMHCNIPAPSSQHVFYQSDHAL